MKVRVALVASVLALLFLAAGSLAQAGPQDKPPSGTLTLTNTPVYGGIATFHLQLNRKARQPMAVLMCGQFGDDGVYRHVYLREGWINTNLWDGPHLDTDLTWGPLMGDPRWDDAVWDTSKIAYCMAIAYDDGTPNGKMPVPITNDVRFTIEPIELRAAWDTGGCR